MIYMVIVTVFAVHCVVEASIMWAMIKVLSF